MKPPAHKQGHGRRYEGLFAKPLKQCVDPLLRPVFKAKGAASSQLIGHWEQLVGPALAVHCVPVKLTFPKDKNSQATLTIACSGAHALTLQHMQPVLLERIASYFGYPAVARIQIEQRDLRALHSAPPRASEGAKRVVACDVACVESVEDEALKEALSALAKTFAGPTL